MCNHKSKKSHGNRILNLILFASLHFHRSFFLIACYPQEDIAAIFCKADKDKSGTLTLQEFQEVVDDIRERYPQVEIYLKKKQMKNFAALLKKTQSDEQKQSTELDIESFKSLLSEVDSQMKNLPATAQVNSYILVILACKSLF